MKVTNREAQALNAVVQHGTVKAASRAMNMTENGVTSRLQAARTRNGVKTTLSLLLAWDRMHRGQQ